MCIYTYAYDVMSVVLHVCTYMYIYELAFLALASPSAIYSSRKRNLKMIGMDVWPACKQAAWQAFLALYTTD